ncbi:hypothetical protein [Halomontanus rarus]|uniref:hypothetical protein n=1 Tax=Halomontanus rarus TaxID=3034020 RepID=UPI0023E893C1|nr:hypothetical protein [Halovivax sp. TS33]
MSEDEGARDGNREEEGEGEGERGRKQRREREPEPDPEPERERECEICGTRVPAAAYHEHLLKECPGERE